MNLVHWKIEEVELDEINEAYDDIRSVKNFRGVIKFK